MTLKRHFVLSVCLASFGFAACSDDPATVSRWPDPDPLSIILPGFPGMIIPRNNPLTVQGVALGRQLFYDPILSADSTQACASCHQIGRAFSDTLRFSVGIAGRPGGRNAPNLTNAGWLGSAFWDGRAATLEDQAFEPVINLDEMGETWAGVVTKLQANPRYPELFGRAFGTDVITQGLVVKAIAQFERTFVSSNSKYDRWLQTRDPVAAGFTAAQNRGRLLFNTETGDCFHCHPPNTLLTDNYFYNTGLDSPLVDLGLGATTLDPNDFGKFKVPSLRNVALTAPYMHDGRFQTLEEVVEHYNSGGFSTPTISPLLRKRGVGLGMTPQQVSDLVAFLYTFTDTSFVNNPALSNPFK